MPAAQSKRKCHRKTQSNFVSLPAKRSSLSLFFFTIYFLLLTPAFAAYPTLGTVSPASGSTAPNTAKVFTCNYSDLDGWANLKEAYLLISINSTTLTNAAYAYYDQNTNLLYLRNDANIAWLGGYTPGSANTIENSYVKLNCASTTVTGATSTLTLKFNLTFKSTYSGKAYRSYLKVVDDTLLSVNWTQKGSYTVNNPPALGTVTPASGLGGPNLPQTFSTTYTDLDSWQNIQYVYFLVNTSTSGTNCLYAYYNQNTNKLYLRNDANTAWIGGYAPGSAYLIQNTYVQLDCAKTIISGSAVALTLNWDITFKPAFTGSKNIYLYVRDDANAYQGWVQKGIITLDATPPLLSLNPLISPTNQNVTLSYSATDDFTPSGEISISGDNSPYINEGDYTVTLTAKDKANNTSIASLSFTIDKTAPAIIITSPLNGQIIEEANIQLQGTVDGVAFSDPYTLIPGNNTLTKTAADSAGNTSSASISAYLYLGTIIGPAGGEVTSADGKVKLIIPPGALTQDEQIKVLNVNEQTLEGAVPQNTSLLSVIECKPYGLIFSQPISLIYYLAHPEIPGTPVSLGLYDAVQNLIYYTGDPSIVPEDGYSLSFTIFHFSTYAALKSLVSQGAPIGGGVKIPLPDMFTGSFSTGIPITVSPGRKGLQPSLGLSYRSSNPNSWVGVGYSLEPGYIVRSTKLGPPSYNDIQDTFYLITDSGTTEFVHLVDNLYQAKIESAFSKFYKEADDSWRVVGKDGSTLRFGQTFDSKETSTSGTFSWHLTRAQDTNGNYIDYSYTKDQGKSYLSRIDYTGNILGVNPTNSVEFILEPRNDITSSYISTSKIATVKRLKEIQVKVNSDLVWRYSLEYIYSPDTNRSLLKSVTQYGADGKLLPAQKFMYQAAK